MEESEVLMSIAVAHPVKSLLRGTFSTQLSPVLELFSSLILFGLDTVRVTHPGLLHHLFWFPNMPSTLYN